MININHLVQLKAFARQDALLLALLWAASFACIMLLNAGFIGNILALATPFLVGYRLKAFRTEALFGVISFRRAYAYSLYVFIYASLRTTSQFTISTLQRLLRRLVSATVPTPSSSLHSSASQRLFLWISQ